MPDLPRLDLHLLAGRVDDVLRARLLAGLPRRRAIRMALRVGADLTDAGDLSKKIGPMLEDAFLALCREVEKMGCDPDDVSMGRFVLIPAKVVQPAGVESILAWEPHDTRTAPVEFTEPPSRRLVK